MDESYLSKLNIPLTLCEMPRHPLELYLKWTMVTDDRIMWLWVGEVVGMMVEQETAKLTPWLKSTSLFLYGLRKGRPAAIGAQVKTHSLAN